MNTIEELESGTTVSEIRLLLKELLLEKQRRLTILVRNKADNSVFPKNGDKTVGNASVVRLSLKEVMERKVAKGRRL